MFPHQAKTACRRTLGSFHRGCAWAVVIAALGVWAGDAVRAQDAGSGPIVVRRSGVTGATVFVTGQGDRPIPMPTMQAGLPGGVAQPGTVNPGVQAREFLRAYGLLFGVTEPDRQLRQEGIDADALGYRHTTYQQVHEGVPVFSGTLRVHQNAGGEIVAANGRFYPAVGKVDPAPALSADEAAASAVGFVVAPNPVIEQAELVVVDPGWYGDPPRGAHLAYQVIVSDADGAVREAFFIDAHDGAILDRWSMICTARNREIYDGLNGYDLPGVLKRAERSGATTPADVNRAYDYYGDVYDYYARAFGRDSIDNAGMTMIATVNSLAPGCPNAFWSGFLGQMVFCKNTVADDVVAHELTHGVTEFTANLIYQNQPGQLNESMSDVFGELVDLFNGGAAFAGQVVSADWPRHTTGPGRDTPNSVRTGPSPPTAYPNGVRWLMGEDASAFGQAIRDMWDPKGYGDPDSANSSLQTCLYYDNGGVHSGSGVPNHAFALATDGGTFNGYTITGVGPIKSGAVWYRALTTYLTATSDFQDAYHSLNRAAADLVGTFPLDPRTGAPSTSEFTAADAAEIDKALRSVEMDTVGACGAPSLFNTSPAPLCPGRTTLFADNFENGLNGWTRANVGAMTENTWRLVSNLPDGRPGSAWMAPDPNSECRDGKSMAALLTLTSPEIMLPANLQYPMLKFDHLVQLEHGGDGGNVKISVNGGVWTLLPAASFAHNPYNLPAVTGNSGNFLGGEQAFSGLSGQWATSLAYLGGLVSGGDRFQVRFEMGRDFCGGALGWFVDDVEVFDCAAAKDCNANLIPDSAELVGKEYRERLFEQAPTGAGTFASDADWISPGTGKRQILAQGFALVRAKTVRTVTIWGGYSYQNQPLDNFTVIFHHDSLGLPGATISRQSGLATTHTDTGRFSYWGLPIWKIELTLAEPVALDAGSYFIEVYNDTTGHPDTFVWESSDYSPDASFAYAQEAPGRIWATVQISLGQSVLLGGDLIGYDCNKNKVPDDCEFPDCDQNGVPDLCDLQAGAVDDCNNNGIPDSCEPDCNNNGIADKCDLTSGAESDCNANGIPDICESQGDCNGNGVQDVCDVHSGKSKDCDGDGTPDECQTDVDTDGVIDACDECPDDKTKTTAGFCGCGHPETDSDGDSVPDCIDVCSNGADTVDTDGDGLPDCADDCPSDANKFTAGTCGCGTPDDDTDGDSIADCVDNCPLTSNKDQADADGDGVGDLCDRCPQDPDKHEFGVCGCGARDVDTDGDGILDCLDNCPNVANADQFDGDNDGVGDLCDQCPSDAAKVLGGGCGCGQPDLDGDLDGIADCVDMCLGSAPGLPVDTNGCTLGPDVAGPDQPGVSRDGDGDGVLDVDDECPGTAVGMAVDAVGCPLPFTPPATDEVPDDAVGGQGCGAVGVVSFAALFIGFAAAHSGAGRRRRTR